MINVQDILSNREYYRLVDDDHGLVRREIFVNEEIFRQELESIFHRAWLFVGHEDLIPSNGDFFSSRMGNDPVILVRDMQGGINVMLNSCTHRGMKVCRYEQGNTRAFTCPYHGWSFSIDGKIADIPGALTGVPGFDKWYRGDLDKSHYGLLRCPNVVNYKGTIWASWDENVPDFLDYLGDMKLYLDAALDHRDGREGGSQMIGGVQKWRVNCNWKFAPENFIGDLYHDISHRSVDLTGIAPSGKGRRDQLQPRTTLCFRDLGHGVIGEPPTYGEREYRPIFQGNQVVEDYYRKVHEDRVRNLGDSKRVTMRVGTIFPNMSFHGQQPRTIAVIHPISATQMEMWRIYLIDRDSPDEVKDMARRYYMRYSGPGGMTESDDMENWSYATQCSEGSIARRQTFNYQMGLGYARPVEGLTGAVECGEYTEENARAFYRRWSGFMKESTWDALMPR